MVHTHRTPPSSVTKDFTLKAGFGRSYRPGMAALPFQMEAAEVLPTTFWSFGHLVVAAETQWENQDVIITPFEDLRKNTPLVSAGAHEFIFYGDVKLPKSTIFLIQEGREETENIIKAGFKLKLYKVGKKREAVTEALKKLGGYIVDAHYLETEGGQVAQKYWNPYTPAYIDWYGEKTNINRPEILESLFEGRPVSFGCDFYSVNGYGYVPRQLIELQEKHNWALGDPFESDYLEFSIHYDLKQYRAFLQSNGAFKENLHHFDSYAKKIRAHLFFNRSLTQNFSEDKLKRTSLSFVSMDENSNFPMAVQLGGVDSDIKNFIQENLLSVEEEKWSSDVAFKFEKKVMSKYPLETKLHEKFNILPVVKEKTSEEKFFLKLNFLTHEFLRQSKMMTYKNAQEFSKSYSSRFEEPLSDLFQTVLMSVYGVSHVVTQLLSTEDSKGIFFYRKIHETDYEKNTLGSIDANLMSQIIWHLSSEQDQRWFGSVLYYKTTLESWGHNPKSKK